jgi:hypothetical protein
MASSLTIRLTPKRKITNLSRTRTLGPRVEVWSNHEWLILYMKRATAKNAISMTSLKRYRPGITIGFCFKMLISIEVKRCEGSNAYGPQK